jgi:hypothetical protein
MSCRHFADSFVPENGGTNFLWSIGTHVQNYTTEVRIIHNNVQENLTFYDRTVTICKLFNILNGSSLQLPTAGRRQSVDI